MRMITFRYIDAFRLKIFIGEIFAFIGLTLSYILVIGKEFDYMGFTIDPRPGIFVLSCFLVIIFAFAGAMIRDSFFYAIWHIFFMYNFFGTLIYVSFNPAFLSLITSQIIFLSFLFFASFVRMEIPFKAYQLNRNKQIRNFIIFISVLLIVPFIIEYGAYVNWRNLLLIDIYETRVIFRSVSKSYLGYLIAPLARVIYPIFLVLAINKKNLKLVLLMIALTLFMFLCGALKSILFGMAAAVLFYWGKYLNKAQQFVLVLLGLTFFGIINYLLIDNIFLLDAFVRRVIFIPPYLNNVYYEYFTQNGFTWGLHSGFVAKIFGPGEYGNLAMYIGESVLGKEGMNANVGVLTEGFFSAGLLGVCITSAICAFLFIYIKALRLDPRFFGIIFTYIYYLNTSFLSTLMLTHGLFFLLIFVTFFLKELELDG